MNKDINYVEAFEKMKETYPDFKEFVEKGFKPEFYVTVDVDKKVYNKFPSKAFDFMLSLIKKAFYEIGVIITYKKFNLLEQPEYDYPMCEKRQRYKRARKPESPIEPSIFLYFFAEGDDSSYTWERGYDNGFYILVQGDKSKFPKDLNFDGLDHCFYLASKTIRALAYSMFASLSHEYNIMNPTCKCLNAENLKIPRKTAKEILSYLSFLFFDFFITYDVIYGLAERTGNYSEITLSDGVTIKRQMGLKGELLEPIFVVPWREF